MTLLYVLSAPDGEVRYVGKTSCSLSARLSGHIKDARKKEDDSRRARWIRSVGFRVQIDLVEEIHGDGAAEEIRLIADLRSLGLRLTNTTNGGEGSPGFRYSPADRAKISIRVFTAEWRARLAEANRKRMQDPVLRAEAVARLRAAALKIVRAPLSAELKAKISATMKAHPVSAEARAKIGAASSQRRHSPETLARMSASHKLAWERRRQRAAGHGIVQS